MEYKDYYQTLELARSANQDEIKPAYRKLARKYHPDVSKEENAEEKFKALNEAYEVLKDPEKRAAYDQLGANWQAGQEFKAPPDWDSGENEFKQGDASAFSDFFEQMFSKNHGDFGFNQEQSFRQAPQDHHAKIVIDLEDSFNGASRAITLQTRVLDKQGRVHMKPHVLNVKIPKGICQGQQMRLKAQGMDSGDGRKGDLYLEINFKPHAIYRINNRDLEFDLPITPWEAALGATVRVPTLAGIVDLKIPANSTSDQRLRLKDRGLPGNSASGNGNLTAVLKIVNPPLSSDKEKALYQKMQQEISFNPRANLGV